MYNANVVWSIEHVENKTKFQIASSKNHTDTQRAVHNYVTDTAVAVLPRWYSLMLTPIITLSYIQSSTQHFEGIA